MRSAVALCLLGAALATSVTVSAHHGYAGFFDPKDRTVAVEGDLVDLVYGNPHVVMKIRAADSTVYTVTWQAARWVERQARVTKSTFHLGDHLMIVGAPSRDPKSREVTRVREVRRMADGWAWRDAGEFARPVPERPANN
jgi:hypothetical protein